MDNCSDHVSDNVICIRTEARVRVIICAPHTIQVFQVLDLALFAVLKRRPRYELPFDDDNTTVKFIITIYHDFRDTMTEPNLWGGGAFRALGLDFEMRREP
jgi:hypothetical protein